MIERDQNLKSIQSYILYVHLNGSKSYNSWVSQDTDGQLQTDKI